MKQLQHFQDALEQMQNQGITKKQLRDHHHMTEWGARKFVDTLPTDDMEVDGRGKLRYHLTKDVNELGKETRQTQIPVTLNNSQVVRESQHNKRTVTEDARNYAEKIEHIAKEIEPPEIEWDRPKDIPHGVDVVWHETDTHIGALVENEHGETVFDSETAVETLERKAAHFQKYVQHQRDAKNAKKQDVDTIHWLLGGDMVEGTGIYGGQAHEIDLYINEQLYKAGEALIQVGKRLVDIAVEIDANLQIVCIPGNHGDMRIKGSNNQASFDDIVYHTLALGLDTYMETQGVEDRVRLKRSDTAVGTTFPLRTHTGYLTHGQHMKEHVGTSSGKKDALSIQNQYDCDVIFRGHYHMPKVEDVNGMPVVMTPSIKPGGSYEDSMQAYSEPGYAFYTATDEKPVKNVEWYNV